MKITIITLFPAMFDGPFKESIVKRAAQKGLVEINLVNLRDFGLGSHQNVDDTIFGGGTGMVLRVDVVDKAIEHAKKQGSGTTKVVLLDARGTTFQQEKTWELSKVDHLILICGHYEGIDDRIRQFLVDETLSIGDFILTGGEIPAMAITDAIIRLLPDVIKEDAPKNESFSQVDGKTVLEYPQYTQPREYKGYEVPEVLLSGNHQKIEDWRKKQAIEITQKIRPDLLES